MKNKDIGKAEEVTIGKHEKSLLEQQYCEAAKDEERNLVFAEWEHLEAEGICDQNQW